MDALLRSYGRTWRVNATDKNLTKGKIGTPLWADDFLYDVNLSGRINATDRFPVKAEIGQIAMLCL
ncbi:MAG: hypothetical protein GY778_23100 [bacterium]|nr:hypothetical protein [bacterium]